MRNNWLVPVPVGLLFIAISVFSLPVLFLLDNPYVHVYIPAVLAGGVGILLVEYRKEEPQASLLTIKMTFLIKVYATLLFLLAIILQHSTTRTIPVHVIITLLYTVVTVAILSNIQLKATISGIILTGIIHRATAVFTSPILFGNDSLYHNRIALEIMTAGSISPLAASLTKYFYAPFYHILIAISSLMASTNIQIIVFGVITVTHVFVVGLIVYKLSNRYYNQSVALFSSLFIISADQMLLFSIQPQTTSLGIILFVLIVYFFIIYTESHDDRFGIVIMLLFGALLATHQVSSGLTVIILTIATVTYIIFTAFEGDNIL